MPVTASYLNYVLEQLEGLGKVTSKRMFGGIGLYYDGWFFGLIDDDVMFFHVDDASRGDYVARDMPAFRPVKRKPELSSANYYQVPGDVLEDGEQLVEWARRALVAAKNKASRKPQK